MTQDFKIKIIDFGHCTSHLSSFGETFGTANYNCREYHSNQEIDHKMFDLWSCAVLLFTLVNGNYPFPTNKEGKIILDDVKYLALKNGNFNEFWSDINDFSDDLKDLLNKMWDLNPTKRPSINQIIKHPWISKNVDYSIYQLLFEDSED